MGIEKTDEEDKANYLIKNEFLSISNTTELAKFFKIKPSVLAYRNYQIPEDLKYKEFTITKKSGALRIIHAPVDKIKFLQRKISQALYLVYRPSAFSHGFEKERSIKSNANNHKKQKYVLNIDIKDFFPAINFGRVRGMFLAKPFSFPEEVATILAQISCHKNELPQGSPSSPIISNIICWRLDRALSRLCIENKSSYSRYADDMTFSTSIKDFPENFGTVDGFGKFNVSKKLRTIIIENGFKLNENKITFRSRYEQQIVTGLVVNRFPNVKRTYIRTVRAMLNAWDIYGLDDAQNEYYQKYYNRKQNRNPAKPFPKFRNIVAGKIRYIGFVREKGERDKVYENLKKKYTELAKAEDSIPKFNDTSGSTIPLIITEGHTDWKHIKAALLRLKENGKFLDLEIDFWEYDQAVKFGDSVLKKFCKRECNTGKIRKYICLFDSDVPEVVRDMGDTIAGFKNWGNSTYSFCIPIPNTRQLYKNISIEMYYSDVEINTKDPQGKMLLFTNQVSESTTNNLTDKTKSVKNKIFLNEPIQEDEYSKKIYDTQIELVKNTDGQTVGISKTVFASRILKKEKDFSNFNIDNFELIFQVIQNIIKSK